MLSIGHKQGARLYRDIVDSHHPTKYWAYTEYFYVSPERWLDMEWFQEKTYPWWVEKPNPENLKRIMENKLKLSHKSTLWQMNVLDRKLQARRVVICLEAGNNFRIWSLKDRLLSRVYEVLANFLNRIRFMI